MLRPRSAFMLICLAGASRIAAQCAPGIPSAGNPGCIPPSVAGSPYAISDGSTPSSPTTQNSLRWSDSWGAIAFDPVEVKAGNAEDQPSQKAANEVAMDYCRRGGGKSCQIAISYHNQCVSVAQAPTGKGKIYYATSAEQEDADRVARQDCGADCITVLKKCSLPRRIE